MLVSLRLKPSFPYSCFNLFRLIAKEADKDKNGKIAYDEFEGLLDTLEDQIIKPVIEKLILYEKENEDPEKSLENLFKMTDLDKMGFLTNHKFLSVILNLNIGISKYEAS
jgi:Ca2+-binding EF-hand superfamily protein